MDQPFPDMPVEGKLLRTEFLDQMSKMLLHLFSLVDNWTGHRNSQQIASDTGAGTSYLEHPIPVQ
jgi:hypothetical protein